MVHFPGYRAGTVAVRLRVAMHGRLRGNDIPNFAVRLHGRRRILRVHDVRGHDAMPVGRERGVHRLRGRRLRGRRAGLEGREGRDRDGNRYGCRVAVCRRYGRDYAVRDVWLAGRGTEGPLYGRQHLRT